MSERVNLKQARGLAELLEAFADTDDEHSANKRAANVINQLCQEVERLRGELDALNGEPKMPSIEWWLDVYLTRLRANHPLRPRILALIEKFMEKNQKGGNDD